jgi:hypothetical protein
MSNFAHHEWLWLTHGVISGASNLATKGAEQARVDAGITIARVAAALSENVKHAEDAYTTTDEDQKDVLNQQMQ